MRWQDDFLLTQIHVFIVQQHQRRLNPPPRAPAEVLAVGYLARLKSHVYPRVSHCDKRHQMLK